MTDPYNQPPHDPYAPQAPEPATNPYAQPPPPPPPLPPAANPPTVPYGQPVGYPQPGYQQPGYQQQGYPQPGYPAMGPQQNSMALVALILAIAGVATYITAPIGAILGHVAMKQIKQTGESGEGMAKAGIIVGWIITVVPLLLCCGLIAIGFIAEASGNS